MIITTLTKVIYLGNGTTKEFPIPFKYSAAETVKVGIYDPNTDKTVILTQDYYVDKVRNAVFYPGYPPGEAPAESEQPGPLPAGKKLVVYRETPLTQEIDLGTKYPLPVIEGMDDKNTMMTQELAEKMGRALLADIGSDTKPNDLLNDIKEKSQQATEAAERAKSEAQAATDAAALAKAWAEAEASPDGKPESKSAKSWAKVAKAWAEAEASPDGNPESKSAKSWAKEAKAWVESLSVGRASFLTMADLIANGTKGIGVGTELKTTGHRRPFDGGGANYVAKFLWSGEAYPWAIDLGETKEPEYELSYRLDGTPELDENGECILKKDAQGNPIPVYESDGTTVKKKHLYAVITDKVVNYRQFGAVLDGEADDGKAIRLCHLYQLKTYTIEPLTGRKHYTVSVENHEGIIRKGDNHPITCCGNIDLSGSELLVKDDNATWFGFYLWGDNEEDHFTFEPTKEATDTWARDNFVVDVKGNKSALLQNALLFLREKPYAVRDDAGYLYSEPRYELLLHTTDGLLTSPITYDWNHPGGLEINSMVSTYGGHEATTQTVNSHFECNYTMLPTTHYSFKGCDVRLNTSANKYCTVLWCKCHNAHISGFNIVPDTNEMHNTVFKNAMIYLWGAYNVEVSNIVGCNAAGKREDGKNGTSGYVLRATNCMNVRLHDISVQGYWGATAMNCVRDVHVERVSINRLDIHNYFYNLWIDACNLFNHSIQIGEGRGICSITNSNFYINKLEADSHPNAHLLTFNLTYGRIFEGRVLIEGCNVYLKDPNGKEFDVCKMDFSPEAVSTLDSYRFPEVTIKDCHFHSYNPDTYFVYFMVAGKRNCKTSTKGPSALLHYSRDLGNAMNGTLMWRYVGRGVDWNDETDPLQLNVERGQVIRTYEKFTGYDGKTVFFAKQYFLVTQAGVLPTPTPDNVPTNYSGEEFALGTAALRYMERGLWEAAREYTVGDFCFTEYSPWLPVYCFECVEAGKSNGWRPTHTAGTEIEGEDVYPKNLDACHWKYVDTAENFIQKHFSPGLRVEAGEMLYADHRFYKVIEGGELTAVPPINSIWFGSFLEGTARLSFVGKDWEAKTWWGHGAFCLSYGRDGTANIYQTVKKSGTTSGSVPVPGNGRCIDGDIIWQNTPEAATKEWQPQTQFFVGDVVSHGGNNYQCVFDGRLELPSQTNIENIVTNMRGSGDVFSFWEKGTDVPTKFGASGKWTIRVKNADCYRFRTFDKGYFCHEGNPQPTIE